MASLLDPFGGGAPGPDLFDQWGQWLDQPGNRAALLQTGLAMMQPVGIGQTAGGHIARAIGEGGAALGREAAFDLKDREMERKEDDTESRILQRQHAAETAGLRAQVAQANSAIAAGNLDVKRQGLESTIALRTAQAQAALARARQADANVQLLEQRAAAYPEDQEVLRQLREAQTARTEAQTELTLIQAAVAPQDAETRRMTATSRQQDADTRRMDADTRRQNVESLTGTREQQLDVNRSNAASNRMRAERVPREQTVTPTSLFNARKREEREWSKYLVDQAKLLTDPLRGDPKYRGKTANDLVNDKAFQDSVRPGFEQRFQAPRAPGSGSGTPAAPAPVAAPVGPTAARPPGVPPDARQAPDGSWVVYRDGKPYRVQLD